MTTSGYLAVTRSRVNDLHVAMNIRDGGESYPPDPTGENHQDTVSYMTLRRSGGSDEQPDDHQDQLIGCLELAIRLLHESRNQAGTITDSFVNNEFLVNLQRVQYWMNVGDLAIDELYASDKTAYCILTHQSKQPGPDWVVQIRADRQDDSQWSLSQIALKARLQSHHEVHEFRHGNASAVAADPDSREVEQADTVNPEEPLPLPRSPLKDE